MAKKRGRPKGSRDLKPRKRRTKKTIEEHQKYIDFINSWKLGENPKYIYTLSEKTYHKIAPKITNKHLTIREGFDKGSISFEEPDQRDTNWLNKHYIRDKKGVYRSKKTD